MLNPPCRTCEIVAASALWFSIVKGAAEYLWLMLVDAALWTGRCFEGETGESGLPLLLLGNGPKPTNAVGGGV